MFKLVNQRLVKNLIKIASPNKLPKCFLNMESKCRQGDPKHLVWVDCEMSGLDVQRDKLLEIAVIITDNDLVELDRLGPLVLQCDKETLDSMSDWCKDNHAKTGLTAKCLKSQLTNEMVDDLLVETLKKHSVQGGVLAGNSISIDSLFIRKNLKKTADMLFYRMLDVSSIKLLKE